MKSFALAFVFAALSYGQSWSGIIASSRAINWAANAGLPATLPDGESTPNPWTPPVRTACTTAQAGIAVPVSSSTSISSLNSAIAACASANPNGSYLLLGSGTFSISSNLVLYGVNNITLRGSGPQSTILSLTSGDNISIGASYGAEGSGALTTDSNYSSGSSSIKIGSLTGTAPYVGMIAWLSQCDTGSGSQPCSASPSDNGSLFVCGDYNGCQNGSDTDSAYNHQNQTVIVTSVTDNGTGVTCGSTHCYTIGISPSIYMPNWSNSSGATLGWPNSARETIGVGLEDLTVYTATANTNNYNVYVQNAYATWIKGVRFIGSAANFALAADHSKSDLFFNNDCSTDFDLTSSYHTCYAIGYSSDTLALNNISAVGLSTEYRGGNVGIVTAYNFARDGFTLYAENLWSFDHHAFSSFMLYEGNQSGTMSEDNTWGTHALNTYFRNYTPCFDAPYYGGTPNARGININNYQRFENLIGNVTGSTECTTYQGTGYGSNFQISTGDSLVASTLSRWGNITVVQQSSDTPANSGIRFVSSEVPSSLSSPNTAWQNPVPSNNNLPCSFYFSIGSSPCSPKLTGGTSLSWWKVCKVWTTFPTACATTQTQPFPPSGPELTSGPYVNGYSYDTPAAVAWTNLPIDTTYQNSYTISSSAWSSVTGTCSPAPAPCETLTFAGAVLPNTTHLQGPFQFSGVNAACSTGASFNSSTNSEILMTNSTSTTVVYSLASNPGVSCTGTMKFPDVRQFDERVYEADGAAAPAPPILNGTVKMTGKAVIN